MPQSDSKVASIEGVRPVIEAIRAGRRRVLEVSIPEGGKSTTGQRELRELCKQSGLPVRPVSGGGGVVARAEPFIEEHFEALLDTENPELLVALDGVTDVGNLGSIARSADAAGATGLILEQRHSPPVGPGALRASAGALEHLRVGRTPNLRKALELAKAEGWGVLAAEAGEKPLSEVDPSLLQGPLVWVFGSEDRGTRASVRAAATERVGIPLAGQVASLGVAASAAHLLLATAEIRRKPTG